MISQRTIMTGDSMWPLKNNYKHMKYILALITAFVTLAVNAQNRVAPAQVEMADGWRANGGIYIVMSVIAIVLVGLFSYLIYVERRLAKLEENQK